MKNKKAVSLLVATALLTLITVSAVGIIWSGVIPMVSKAMQASQVCMTARVIVDTRQGYTCYDENNKRINVMISRGAEDFNLGGIQLGLASVGIVKNYVIQEKSNSTKLMLHLDGADGSTAITDETGKTVTANGNAQIDTAQSQFGGASGLFDGNGDYLTLADSDDWYFGTGDFTIDFWVRFNNTIGHQRFGGQYADGNNRWLISKLDTGGLYFLFISGGAAKALYSTGDLNFQTNNWYHIVFERYGAGAKIFVNGINQPLIETTAFGNNNLGDVNADLWIGGGSEAPAYLNGWIDELRISKGIARWTDNFAFRNFYAMLPAKNEAVTYILGGENATEVNAAPIVRFGNQEKTCGVTSKTEIPKCTY